MKEFDEQTARNEEFEIPDKLKLDLKTPLETFFMWSAIIGGFILVAGIIGYIEEGLQTVPKLLLAAGAILLPLFISLYNHTDNYYIVDISGEQILYHFKFFFFRRVTSVCRFNEISLVTTGGKREKSKYATWWEYAVFILTTDGNLLQMSDFKKDAFDKQKELARRLCDITGSRFIDAPEERIVRAAGLNCVRHEAYTLADSFVEIGMIFVITGFIIAIFVTLFTFGAPLLKLLESAGK